MTKNPRKKLNSPRSMTTMTKNPRKKLYSPRSMITMTKTPRKKPVPPQVTTLQYVPVLPIHQLQNLLPNLQRIHLRLKFLQWHHTNSKQCHHTKTKVNSQLNPQLSHTKIKMNTQQCHHTKTKVNSQLNPQLNHTKIKMNTQQCHHTKTTPKTITQTRSTRTSLHSPLSHH